MFHMPGRWELRLQLMDEDSANTEDLVHDITVE
jgi:hypothetical protein